MKQTFRVYCSSCWIAAVAHVVAFFAWLATMVILYYLFKGVSNDFLMYFLVYFMAILFIFVVASWFMIPVSIIANLCMKQWLKALVAMTLGALATIPIGIMLLYFLVMQGMRWDG